MIIDRQSNLKKYVPVVDNLQSALDFLKEHAPLDNGTYEFDGGYIMASEGMSVHISEKKYENHRKYIDVMLIMDGEETFCYKNKEGMRCVQPFGDGDIEFLDTDENETSITLTSGYAYIVFPSDAHKPCIHTDREKYFKKYVVKCAVNNPQEK